MPAFIAVLKGLPAVLKLLSLLFLPVLGLAIRKKWRLAAAGREEIQRLVVLAAEEAAEAEVEAARVYSNRIPYDSSSTSASSLATSSSSSSLSFPSSSSSSGIGPKGKSLCAVCHKPTSTRCSRCKSVKYCSVKCQIIHWREGHKEKCRPPVIVSKPKDPKDYSSSCLSQALSSTTVHKSIEDLTLASSLSNSSSVSTSSTCSTFTISSDSTDDISSDGSSTREKPNSSVADETFSNKIEMGTVLLAEIFDDRGEAEVLVNRLDGCMQSKCVSPFSTPIKQSPVCGGIMSKDESLEPRSSSSRESMDRNHSASQERPRKMESTSFSRSRHLVLQNLRVPSKNSGLSSSAPKIIQLLKPSEVMRNGNGIDHISQTVFSYDVFIKLYNDKVEIRPFGLMNCGNSCYANVVIQCLVFTRPLYSYLLQGFHSLSCLKDRWCFTCELESLILKAKQGESVLSLASIMCRVQNIGVHLGQGKEEDAHEFLRSAVDTMHSPTHKENSVNDAIRHVPEAALMHFIFGGYIRSKIKCMNCQTKSARNERMMDLTVGIPGNVSTLEDALSRFTDTEILDGVNRYNCSRCKSYQKARKRLKVLQAPNILSIALKRFQSGKYGKLNKQVAFPEKLNLTKYMSSSSKKDDKYPIYELYAVVVHLDFMDAAFSGHYVCYVRSTAGKWFKIDDGMIKPVEAKNVLSKTAYMLFYARQSPRNVVAELGRAALHGPDQKRFGDFSGESSDSCSSVFSGSPSGSCSTDSVCWSSSANSGSVSSSPVTFSDDSDDADLTYIHRRCGSSSAAILDSDPDVDLTKFMWRLRDEKNYRRES